MACKESVVVLRPPYSQVQDVPECIPSFSYPEALPVIANLLSACRMGARNALL
jgi:hypothetical protein